MRKLHKQLVAFLLPLLFSGSLLAQEWMGGIGGGVGIYVPKYVSMNEFLDSYNSYFSSEIKSPAKFSSIDVGRVLNIHFGIPGLMMTAHTATYRNKSEAEFNNGNKRHFDLDVKDFGFDLGIGGGEEGFFVNILGGFGLRSNQLRSYYEYADGTISYGKEKGFNGITEGWGWKFYVGGALAVPLGDFDEGGFQLVIKPHYTWYKNFSDKWDDVSEFSLPKKVDVYYSDPGSYPLPSEDTNGEFYVDHKTREFSVLVTLRYSLTFD